MIGTGPLGQGKGEVRAVSERGWAAEERRGFPGLRVRRRRGLERERTASRVGRQAMMQLSNVSKEQGDAAGLAHWQALKRRWLEYERSGFPPNATRVCAWHTKTLGGWWYDPLAELVDLMASASYAELNRPRPKSLAVRAFPALAETPVLHGGLQVVAGVREFMDQVVAREHGCAGAAAYYRHIAHQLGIKARGSAEAKELWSSR